MSTRNISNKVYIHAEDLPAPIENTGTADFTAADALKRPLLTKAAKTLLAEKDFAELRFHMEQFKEDNPWVLESALFDCLKRDEGRQKSPWWDWEPMIRDRDEATLKALREKHANDIEIFIAVQLLFDRQWKSLKVQPSTIVCLHLSATRPRTCVTFRHCKATSSLALHCSVQPAYDYDVVTEESS